MIETLQASFLQRVDGVGFQCFPSYLLIYFAVELENSPALMV
jgi:hypothetical protein